MDMFNKALFMSIEISYNFHMSQNVITILIFFNIKKCKNYS